MNNNEMLKATSGSDTDNEVPVLIMQVEGRYPQFTNVIYLMGYDNNMRSKPPEEWPAFLNYELLEDEVNKLTDYDLTTLVIGETTEKNQIVEQYGIHQLSMVLNMAFDGALHEFFFYL